MSKSKKKLRVIPLGGLGEVGKNITVFEYDEEIVIVVTTNPDIISRGFIYVRESEDLIAVMRMITKNVLDEHQGKDWSTIKNNVKKTLGDYLYTQTKRKPMILPIIVEV